MSRVTWSPENDRKLLLQLMMPASKDISVVRLAALFPGATSKSIIERIAKLRREKKAMPDPTDPKATPAGTSSSPPPSELASDSVPPGSSPNTTSATTTATSNINPIFYRPAAYLASTSPTKPKGLGARSAITGEVVQISDPPRGKKRGRPSKASKAMTVATAKKQEKNLIKDENSPTNENSPTTTTTNPSIQPPHLPNTNTNTKPLLFPPTRSFSISASKPSTVLSSPPPAKKFKTEDVGADDNVNFKVEDEDETEDDDEAEVAKRNKKDEGGKKKDEDEGGKKKDEDEGGKKKDEDEGGKKKDEDEGGKEKEEGGEEKA